MTEFEFMLLALGVAAAVLLIERPLTERSEMKRYTKERERFQKEVDSGIDPDWCPQRISYNGALSVDPADLVRTANFKRALAANQTVR